MMRMSPVAGELDTRYDVLESDARPALNTFIRFEGVNGVRNGFSRLSLRGRLLGVVGAMVAAAAFVTRFVSFSHETTL